MEGGSEPSGARSLTEIATGGELRPPPLLPYFPLSVWWVQAVRHARGREPTQAARCYGSRWCTRAGPVVGLGILFGIFFIYFIDLNVVL
jgi:hypothetical protein